MTIIGYEYKIQWLFRIVSSFDGTAKKNRYRAYSVIKELGVRNFDKLVFRDENRKIISTWDGFMMYDWAEGYRKTKCEIRRMVREGAWFVELVRT